MATINIKKLDFVPQGGGSYNLNWPGPPRVQLRYSDVKHYIPIVELSKPSPIGFTLCYNVREYRESAGVDELKSDIDLAFFHVRFEAGNTIPSEIKELNHLAGPPRDAENSPQYTYGSFWLGASKAGNVRGNIGTGDGRHARVYLESCILWMPDAPGHQTSGKTKSSKHTVRSI